MSTKDSSKKQSFSILSTILLVLLFVLTLFFYEYWQGTTIFNQIKTWLLSLTPSVGITIDYGVNPSAKKPPVVSSKVYSNAKYIFSFSYPETLDLYHESSEDDLETFYKEEKYKPLAKLFFEEKTITTESNSNPRSLPLPLSFLSLFGIGNSPGTRKDPSGYTFNLSLNSKSSSESVSGVALNSKDNLCRLGGGGQANIIMTETTIASVAGVKFVCEEKNYIFIFTDPRNKRQFFRIEGEIKDFALAKKTIFQETLKEILDSFSFNTSPNHTDSPVASKSDYTFVDAQKVADLNSLRTSLNIYYMENNKYPSKLEDLVPVYLKSMVNDPVTNLPFSYQLLNGGTDYKICINFDSNTVYGITKGINCFFAPK